MTDAAAPLKEFKVTKSFFVGIDSDGCVFDTMGIKQRECFCPWTVACYNLQPVAEAARECRVFADLFSKTRGNNRYKTLKRILIRAIAESSARKTEGIYGAAADALFRVGG